MVIVFNDETLITELNQLIFDIEHNKYHSRRDVMKAIEQLQADLAIMESTNDRRGYVEAVVIRDESIANCSRCGYKTTIQDTRRMMPDGKGGWMCHPYDCGELKCTCLGVSGPCYKCEQDIVYGGIE